jgi:hypothetical protein
MTIASKTIKLFGETRVFFQLCKGNQVVGVYATREEAEAAQAAL